MVCVWKVEVWVLSKTVFSENSSMAIHIQNIFISAVFKKDCVCRLTTLYNGLFITQKKACCGITKHFIFHPKWDWWCTLIVKQPLTASCSAFFIPLLPFLFFFLSLYRHIICTKIFLWVLTAWNHNAKQKKTKTNLWKQKLHGLKNKTK